MDVSGLASNSGIPVFSAFLLGLMAAVGPCTMATNIAALAYVSRRLTDRRYCIMTGILYTLGRMLTYTALGILIIWIGLEIPDVSIFLQGLGETAIGWFLIAIGILLLLVDRISFGRAGNSLSSLGGKVADWGIAGSFPLGAIFALAFCPYSAVLFFAVLLPLALKTAGGVTLPAFFAVGTALPVLVFGLLLAFGASGVSRWVDAIGRAEKVIRIVIALVFIGAGIYCLVPWITGLFVQH